MAGGTPAFGSVTGIGSAPGSLGSRQPTKSRTFDMTLPMNQTLYFSSGTSSK
jgi:hypothetical protein